MLGPRVGPGGSLSVTTAEAAAGGRFQMEGIAQDVLLWFQYYIRCMKYKVLMRVSAAFCYQNGKTIAYLCKIVCICLLMTMYKGVNSCEQSQYSGVNKNDSLEDWNRWHWKYGQYSCAYSK